MRKFMNMISEAMNEDLTTEDIETVIRYIDCDGPVKIGFGNFERQWLPSVIAHKMLGDGWESFIRTNLPAAREFEAARLRPPKVGCSSPVRAGCLRTWRNAPAQIVSLTRRSDLVPTRWE
jgi:hypothetical protein